MDIKQILLDQLSGAATEKLGSQNGLDANQTNSTVNAAVSYTHLTLPTSDLV